MGGDDLDVSFKIVRSELAAGTKERNLRGKENLSFKMSKALERWLSH